MPDGLDSTDDESVNLLNYRPVALKSHHGHADFDLSERSRILDGLMDTSFDSVDNIEVEEAVKGRAEQAEQTANRFLELTEPEDDAGLDSANETTFVQNASSQDVPVPYTPEAQPRSHDGSSRSDSSHVQGAEATPLLERLQKLHLADSPARSQHAEPAALVLAKFTQDRWWMDKAACKFVPIMHIRSLADRGTYSGVGWSKLCFNVSSKRRGTSTDRWAGRFVGCGIARFIGPRSHQQASDREQSCGCRVWQIWQCLG